MVKDKIEMDRMTSVIYGKLEIHVFTAWLLNKKRSLSGDA